MWREWALVALTSCGLGTWGLACGEGDTSPPRDEVWRAVAPEAGSDSTAELERVEIGIETRPVLGRQPLLLLRWREPVELADELRIETLLPAELARGAPVSVETWISVRDASDAGAELKPGGARGAQMRALAGLRRGGRRVLRDGPRVVNAGDPSVVRMAVPADLEGRRGLLSAVARPLPEQPTLSWRRGPLEVPPGASLRFAYGVEQEGWEEGWPAVEFRVRAEPQGEAARELFQQRLDPARRPAERSWQEAVLDLAALAGRRTSLVFEAEALAAPGISAPRSLPVFGSPEVRGSAPDARRSIVLVSLDTLRAQSVGSYGAARATTPGLDRNLAAAGARVRQAVTPFPFTPPSHMTMLTGLDPCMHGVIDQKGVLPRNQLTLAEILGAAGYRTAAFTENGYVSAAAGFARGFDVWVERRDEKSAAPGWARETFAAAARWLDGVGDEPFFLFVHTYEVHDPYAPPPEYRELFSEEIPGSPARQHDALRSYEREIRYTDDLLAGFLETLDARGLRERSIVVVTSDHGEGFGEHFVTGHGYDAHDESVLVPLVVRAPGLVPPGRVIEQQVGLADLVPTLLELVGAPPLPALAGRSFAPALLGETDAETEASEVRPILIDTVTKQVAVRTNEWKYLRNAAGKERLYRLADDPLERHNAADSEPEALAAAQAALDERQRACQAWLAQHPPEPAVPERGRRAPGWLVNRDEVDEQLRALGYAQ